MLELWLAQFKLGIGCGGTMTGLTPDQLQSLAKLKSRCATLPDARQAGKRASLDSTFRPGLLLSLQA